MARQAGPIKITGTIGNMIFYKRGDNYFIRPKPEPAPKSLVKGKGYAHQRAGMLEFGHAGKAGNLLYRAFAGVSSLAKDSNLSAHLLREALKAIRADKLNEPGKRNITDGGTTLLEGFEFNERIPLCKMLLAPYTAIIDRKTGRMTVTIHERNQERIARGPSHATHLLLTIAGAEVDFVNNKYIPAVTSGIELPMHGTLSDDISLTVQLPLKSKHPLFLALRISFLQEFNGTRQPLRTTAHNAMAFVKVSRV
ncbi:hypothetical protein GFS24_17710 [Chitinophaga sp. SYP-B3965]|uniref:hypothetical protein n=1 Tax=Chitinophaga sp. SYP-B3965 TaxID=2663120 RepID=UPI001299552A|nr:hypothetical protein [Chitinophaga sp. SYP-B3965]MRG46963.1 hypothetical protein [Chitinophaga sp. SYP-B3965]